MTTKLSVAILYGFGEGQRHGRTLQAALLAADFAIAATAHDADVIIAHSGGMYTLPDDTSGKTIFLIAPSCGRTDKTWLQTQSQKVWQDMNYFLKAKMFAKWMQKSLWNAVYLIGQASGLPHLWNTHQQHQAGLPTIAAPTVVVTFKNDPWSGYISAKEKDKHPDYTFLTIEATHDDLWLHPDRYVELVQEMTSPKIRVL